MNQTKRHENDITRTLSVRGDVDLSGRKVGERVMFRVTEIVAINVRKP